MVAVVVFVVVNVVLVVGGRLVAVVLLMVDVVPVDRVPPFTRRRPLRFSTCPEVKMIENL